MVTFVCDFDAFSDPCVSHDVTPLSLTLWMRVVKSSGIFLPSPQAQDAASFV